MHESTNRTVPRALATDPEGRILLAENASDRSRGCTVMIVDEVLTTIEREIAAPSADAVGQLIGPIGVPVLAGVVLEPHRRTDASIFEFHAAPADLEVKGVLRCQHDGVGLVLDDVRMTTDRHSVTPVPGRYIYSVVTRRYRRPERHEMVLPSGIMSVFVAEQTAGGVHLRPARLRVLPIRRDIGRLARMLGGSASPLGVVDVDGIAHVSAAVTLETFMVRVLFAPGYPFQSPVVLVQESTRSDPDSGLLDADVHAGFDHTIVPLPITWDLTVSERARLEHAVGAVHGLRAQP